MMNPAALAMMPTMVSNNPKPQGNTISSNSSSTFGEILKNTVSNKEGVSEVTATETQLTSEQKQVLEDLLAFLKVDNLSEMEDGTLIAEMLEGKDLGEDGSSVAELLANILNINFSVNAGDETEKENSLLSKILSQLKAKEIQNQNMSDNSSELSTIFAGLTSNETQDKNQLDIPSEIYALLQKLDSLDAKDWSNLDLNDVTSFLKLAKLQDLLSSQRDLFQDAILMQKEIKKLLESISGKLEKWLDNQPTMTGNEDTFAVLLKNGTNKSLDVVKQIYASMIHSEEETADETVSNGLTLKTSETNTQSSGLPFQMTKLEQYVLTASKNGQAVDSEQFVKSFENILSKANFSKTNGVQKLLIRLNPENLGSLRIELVQKDGTMVAKILATSAQAKELLDRQVQGLKQSFTNQNIQVEKIEISQQISTYNAERFSSRDQGQHEQHQQQTEQEIVNDEEETDFINSFEEALLNLKV